jgi:undecaprenyl-diphosphatase
VLHIIDILSQVVAAPAHVASDELTAIKAAVLGLVEGVTEFLPISSTGHLIVTERLLDIGQRDVNKDAADTYAITIQAGAILAVVALYWSRVRTIARGLIGRDAAGRQLLLALALAFVPAAVAAIAFEDPIKDRLFGVGPVVAAWIVGGVAILVFARVLGAHERAGRALEAITLRDAVVIGVAQCVALWPGTSRSLVTILAALALGFTVAAAVEFSFLLGLVTLGAATAYDGARNGNEMIDAFGILEPLIGFVVAFVAALVAVRWMVRYLERHGIGVFGWYRIGIAGVTLVLLATGVL